MGGVLKSSPSALLDMAIDLHATSHPPVAMFAEDASLDGGLEIQSSRQRMVVVLGNPTSFDIAFYLYRREQEAKSITRTKNIVCAPRIDY